MRICLTICCLFVCIGIACAQHKEQFVPVNGTSLYVRMVGQGNPLIVIHGGPGLNHSYLWPHLQGLANHHLLVFIDQRACGNSMAVRDSAQMSLNLLVEDVEAIRKILGLGKVSILAHSWGAILGVLYASRYPENIRSLILTNSVSLKAGEFDAEINGTLGKRISHEDSTERSRLLSSPEFKAGNIETITEVFKLSFRPSFFDKGYLDSLGLILPADFVEKRKALFFLSREMSDYNFYNDLKLVKCPVLIIHGEYDAIPIDVSHNIQRLVNNSKLVLIKDAGHFPFVEQKKKFISVIDDFL
jgi:proline iminopeptidase